MVSEEAQAGAGGAGRRLLRALGRGGRRRRARELLESCAVEGIVFRDAFSATDGIEEMLANLEAVRMHMPGVSLVRSGEIRAAHGTALIAWVAQRDGGEAIGRGTNVIDFAPDGRIARVVGFWDR